MSKTEGITYTIILATENDPIVLCLNASPVFSNNSPVISSMIKYIKENATRNTSVANAMNAVQTIRSRQTEKESVCFVFTDGKMDSLQRKDTISIITSLDILDTDVIGVGIGIAPKMIEKVFRKCIWSEDPMKTPNAVTMLLNGENKFNNINNIKYPEFEKAKDELIKRLEDIVSSIIKRKINPVFAEFVEKMSEFHISLTSLEGYYNKGLRSIEERNVADPKSNTGPGNDPNIKREDDNSESFDLGKGQKWPLKILICQFWDRTMQKGERNSISYENLVGEYGIVKSIKSLGITVDVVQNYKESILCLTSGEYHQAWVICGRGDKIKPKTRGST